MLVALSRHLLYCSCDLVGTGSFCRLFSVLTALSGHLQYYCLSWSGLVLLEDCGL